jgi:hypothetical protein
MSSSSTISLIIFSTHPQENELHDIMSKYFNNNSNITAHSQKDFFSFTYQLKSNKNTKIKLFYLNSFDCQYEICLNADAYVLFVDLQCKDVFNKMGKIIKYIKELCSYDVKTYVYGKYESNLLKVKEFDVFEMNDYLNGKYFLYEYDELENDSDGENMRYQMESLFEEVYSNKKNQYDYKLENEMFNENYCMDKDEGTSTSNCLVL